MTAVRAISVFVCILLVASCGRDPEIAKREYFEAGNRLFGEKKFAEAVIEYRNAVAEDSNFGEARFKLAEAFAQTGDTRSAYREYMRAADLLPNDMHAQMKAATNLLLAGEFSDARTRVQRVLDREPTNVEALILRGSALAGLKDLSGAVRELEDAIRIEPDRGLTYTNLAFLKLASGERDEARAAFIKAVELDPRSIPALLSLSNFQWAAGEVSEAAETIKKALSIDPAHPVANRALATLYIGLRRFAEAETHLKALASSTAEPEPKFSLADYYVSMKRPADAKSILEPLAANEATFVGAQARLAEVEYVAGQHSRAHAMLDEVLAQAPTNAPALLVKAAWLFRERKPAEALPHAAAAVKADAASAAGHYLLGTIQAALYDNDAAVLSFQEVLRLSPGVAAAQVQLSRLELLRGNTEKSVQLASEAAKTAPRAPAARLSLARSLIGQRDIRRAEEAMAALLKDYPNTASVHALNGSLQLVRRDFRAARAALERAQQIDPDSFDAFSGLVSLDVMEKRVPAARARVDEHVRTSPESVDLLLLAARVYIEANDGPAAERTLRRLVERAPSDTTAYTLLAQVYLAQGKLDQALTEFDRLGQRNPKDVGSRTMAAIIVHSRQNLPEAQKRYEEILDIDRTAAVASNNLAWILSESVKDLDRALTLAQRALQQQPEAAEYNATVGWVYIKKQLPSLAIAPLERAIGASPDNPTFHYHLGMAHAANGNSTKARAALQKALALGSDFAGAADARTLLASLRG